MTAPSNGLLSATDMTALISDSFLAFRYHKMPLGLQCTIPTLDLK